MVLKAVFDDLATDSNVRAASANVAANIDQTNLQLTTDILETLKYLRVELKIMNLILNTVHDSDFDENDIREQL